LRRYRRAPRSLQLRPGPAARIAAS
jgi:hypothetical protein